MAFRSRRRSFRTRGRRKTHRFGRTKGISFKRSTRGRRGFRRSRGTRAVNIRNTHTKMTREFLWGSLTSYQDGTTAGVLFTQPDNNGGLTGTPLALESGSIATYNLGQSANFSLNDLPTGDADLVRLFNWYKLDSVTLKFKPRWTNSGQDVSIGNTLPMGGPVAGGGGGAPRLYMHTQHDQYKIATDSISPDYILSYGDHTVYDLSKQRLYHIKPSTTQLYAVNGMANSNTERPMFGRWFATSLGTTGSLNEVLYQGLQIAMEWENPPLPLVVPATHTTGTTIDIYATYTVSMKQLEV